MPRKDEISRSYSEWKEAEREFDLHKLEDEEALREYACKLRDAIDRYMKLIQS